MEILACKQGQGKAARKNSFKLPISSNQRKTDVERFKNRGKEREKVITSIVCDKDCHVLLNSMHAAFPISLWGLAIDLIELINAMPTQKRIVPIGHTEQPGAHLYMFL